MHLLTRPTPPIAMLYYVSDNNSGLLADWSISQRSFLQLLDTLTEAGFKTTHFTEWTENGKRAGIRNVILSFDDCSKQLFEFAIPELVKRTMKAVFLCLLHTSADITSGTFGKVPIKWR